MKQAVPKVINEVLGKIAPFVADIWERDISIKWFEFGDAVLDLRYKNRNNWGPFCPVTY